MYMEGVARLSLDQNQKKTTQKEKDLLTIKLVVKFSCSISKPNIQSIQIIYHNYIEFIRMQLQYLKISS